MRDLAVVQPMPPLDADAPALSAFEFWPAPVFYAPLMPLIGWLMLRHGVTAPLAANPGLPASGLVGESKSEVFSAFTGPQRELLASWIVVERTGSIEWQARDIERRMTEAGFGYPAVAKPDIGCRGAGVRPLHNRLDLIDYLWAFPRDGRLVIQQMVRADGEAGIFYVRRPGDRRGRIISLTLKYFPHVFGDGQATLEQLIRADKRAGRIAHLYLPRFEGRRAYVPGCGEAVRLVFAGNHCRGAIFRNGNHLISEALERRFDAIADSIEGFHFGRFDIRFSDWRAMVRGQDFSIVEYNGAGAEATHIWDSRTTLWQAWRALAQQYRLLFEIGAANRKLGHRTRGIKWIWNRWRTEKRLIRCYPSTA